MCARRPKIGCRLARSLAVATVLVVGVAVPAAAADPPTITSFSPTSGSVGTVVTIVGTNFIDVTGVNFKNAPAPFTVNSPTQITATVPPDATSGKISVTTLNGTARSSANFSVTAPGAPTITSFSPTSGPVATSVSITGTNFINVSDVKFKNTSATFTVNSSTQITAIVPSGALTGPIAVTNPSGTATSSTNFTVTVAGAPTTTSFSPTSGAVGTSVSIFGTNFTNVTGVRFNRTSASFTVNSSTQITATVPPGAASGPISVTNLNGTATSTTNFTVVAAPTITSFSPTSGPVGTSVTITGTNFTGATAVRFNNVTASFVVNSSTKITATVPVGATTGLISVTGPGGTATSSTNFTVVGPTHQRTVSLRLARHLVTSGLVVVSDGFTACRQNVVVRIQRLVSGNWRTVAEILTANDGSYRTRVADRIGKYRARAIRTVLASGDVCGRATSAIKLNSS